MSKSDIDTTTDSKEPKPTQFCEVKQTDSGLKFEGQTDKQHITTDMYVSLESWR